MNKFAKVMCMIAVVALAFTSCKKKENEQGVIRNVTTQEFVEVYDGEDGGAKAYIDGNRMKFESGDMFELIAYGSGTKDHQTYKYYEGLGYWDVEPQGTPYINNIGGSYWYAFYPAANVKTIDLSGDHARATFTLSDKQTYRPGNIVPENALYMACKDDTHNTLGGIQLNFENICGIMCLQLYSSTGMRKVKSIEITDHAFNIVGDVSCNIDQIVSGTLQSWCENYEYSDANNAQLYQDLQTYFGYESGTNAKRTIILDCNNGGNGVALGTDAASATKFYIVMRPLALIKGVDITVKFTSGPDWEISSPQDNRIMPNVIKNLNPRNVG
jgi:hypothetical protein